MSTNSKEDSTIDPHHHHRLKITEEKKRHRRGADQSQDKH